MSTNKKEAYYVTDPMCSWCWGFSPVMERVRESYEDRMDVSVVMGGLRIGTTERMTDAMRKMVVHHWEEVNKLTGQEFCYDFDMPESFRYDTEPACRAVATVRRISAARTFPYLRSVHRSFYVENRDVTDSEILAELAVAQDIERDIFLTAFESKALRRETFDDFVQANNWGIRGFPAVVLKAGEGYKLLTIGYQHFEALQPHIEAWLDSDAANVSESHG